MLAQNDRIIDLLNTAPQNEAALPPSSAPPGSVSVIVLCCGQLEFTRLCVSSLLRHSRAPYELIFVDIGSLDGTPEFLAGVAAAAPVRVEVVHVSGDSAFPAACAEGIAAARGEFVVWLNNDTIVTESWLQHLVALANMKPEIGLVGPMSNYAPAPQRAGPVAYHLGPRMVLSSNGTGQRNGSVVDIEPVNRFAREWREQHRGECFETDRLGGFCLLMKRELLQRVDLFNDGSVLTGLNADAVCSRIRRAGYQMACCKDLFIHHFGSRIAYHDRPDDRH